MPEREPDISREVYRQAAQADGFRLSLAATDEFSLHVRDNNVTLSIRPKPASEPARSEQPAPPPQEAPAAPAEQASKRVTLSGRVASDPRYAPLPKRGLRVGFVVAEHQDDGSTTFHHAYATGDYARRIQQKHPLKGDAVTIEGERQHHPRRQPDGSMQDVAEIYCYGLRVTVSPRRAPPPARPPRTNPQ